jgi:hypothetical protein
LLDGAALRLMHDLARLRSICRRWGIFVSSWPFD